MAAYAYHAMVLGYTDQELYRFLAKALFAVGEDWGMEELLPIVLEVGKYNLSCMELLDRANTETFGTPVPTVVPLTVEKGPFIVISGHDLLDLKLLLEQTQGKGINVYTHGEMLPAHGYPELKKYPHLKGNFGTAWQNQQKEFADLPAPILFTTNCLMPPRPATRIACSPRKLCPILKSSISEKIGILLPSLRKLWLWAGILKNGNLPASMEATPL